MVFISHSRDDEEIVKEVIDVLEEHKIEVWHDQKIKSGNSWKQSIFSAITKCKAIVIFLSKSYINSPMCRMEAFLAQCYGIRTIPVMIKESCREDLVVHSELSILRNLSILDLIDYDMFGLKFSREEQLEKLISTARGDHSERFRHCDLFISFRKCDAEYATQLARDLYSQKKIKTWIATLAYTIGENRHKRQWEALMHAKGLVVVLNQDVAESEHMRKEILVAISRGIPIYPVLPEIPEIESTDYLRKLNDSLDDTKSFEMRELNEIQWFSPNKPDYETMLDEIALSYEENKK